MPDNIKALRGYIKDRVLYGDSAFFATEDAESCADEIERLREEIKAARDTIFLLRRSTLTSAELRLVDKNCDWEPFRHAFNAVMNHRLSCANKNAVFALEEKE